MIDKALLAILACPLCKGNLLYREKDHLLICQPDKLAFEIRDGIPIMLPEEAKPFQEDSR